MTNTRRDFIKTAGGITVAGAALTGGLTAFPEAAAQTSEKGKLTEHTLPPLPYAYDALEPVQVQFETIRKAMTTAAATQAMVWVCRLR